jgi:hypothetical protein
MASAAQIAANRLNAREGTGTPNCPGRIPREFLAVG